MLISIGNDIIETKRIREVWENYGERFIRRIYSESEIDYCLSKKDPVPYLAARFACKEAFIKAIDYPPDERVDMREISLEGKGFGKKRLSLSGKSKELFNKKGYKKMDASISHTKDFASAVVILYGPGKE